MKKELTPEDAAALETQQQFEPDAGERAAIPKKKSSKKKKAIRTSKKKSKIIK